MKKVFIYGDENVYVNYKNALTSVGAKAVISTNTSLSDDCDALVLAGGGDVSPCFYGSLNSKNCRSVNLVKDVTEQYLLARFERKNAPVLGVCRGLQLINAYYSGTLATSIKKHYLHFSEKGDVYHPIERLSGFMRDIYGDALEVNSCHRQCVERLGKNMSVCAYAPDGTCEAACLKNGRIFGVQFHPERAFSGGNKRGLKIYEYLLSLI